MSQKAIRAVLKANPDGLTVPGIAAQMKKHASNTYRQIKEMPDVYIDRWEHAPAHSPVPYLAVYVTVDVPENAPMPD